jgi:hypothetical protein
MTITHLEKTTIDAAREKMIPKMGDRSGCHFTSIP